MVIYSENTKLKFVVLMKIESIPHKTRTPMANNISIWGVKGVFHINPVIWITHIFQSKMNR